MTDHALDYDVLVLGAGMVGVCSALYLQRSGRSVALIDRRAPGQETSFGNAGLIQREAEPYALPRRAGFLLGAMLNRRLDVRVHWHALPGHIRALLAYLRHSAPSRYRKIAQEYDTLIAHCLHTHTDLIEQAQAQHLLAPQRGFLALYRTQTALYQAFEQANARAAAGIHHAKLDAAALATLEPALQETAGTAGRRKGVDTFVGAVHWTDPLAVRDPGTLVQAYVQLFERLGGTVLHGDAMTLARRHPRWQVQLADGSLATGQDAVIALGPWSVALTAKFGYRPPLFFKRGYHMHYASAPGQTLNHWLLDAERGYALCPMAAGIRLTTGAELARLDAPPTPAQLTAAEAVARAAFPLGERLDAQPWMGARPCLPDMKPVFGRVPGTPHLWCNFGHGHQGFTLGPITGQLLAALMTGTATETTDAATGTPMPIDCTPFAPARF